MKIILFESYIKNNCSNDDVILLKHEKVTCVLFDQRLSSWSENWEKKSQLTNSSHFIKWKLREENSFHKF